jgi:hypothetical protein
MYSIESIPTSSATNLINSLISDSGSFLGAFPLYFASIDLTIGCIGIQTILHVF